MISYEDVCARHLAEWGSEFCPQHDQMAGFACRRDGELVALGIVWADEAGKWWCAFDRRQGCPVGVHRSALKIVGALAEAGVPDLWATLDASKTRAREWMEHVGFTPADPEEKVWRLGLSRSTRWGRPRRRRLDQIRAGG